MTRERDDEILRLMEQEHLRARTIARRLGISESIVSRAWRRADERRRLRDELLRDDDDEYPMDDDE